MVDFVMDVPMGLIIRAQKRLIETMDVIGAIIVLKKRQLLQPCGTT